MQCPGCLGTGWDAGHVGNACGRCPEGDLRMETLASAAPQLVRALLVSEWELARGAIHPRCPRCGEFGSHGPGCRIDAALTAAGFPDKASRDAARALIASARL